ncbi:MAG: hypothetical protein ACUVUC_11255 [Thermoguttaceae bacterium]
MSLGWFAAEAGRLGGASHGGRDSAERFRIPHGPPGPADPLSPQAAARWMGVFLALGLLARLVRYGLRFPLWYDEAALAANLLDRGFGELLRPLEAGQVCPVLFLAVQLGFVKLLGFTEYSLRLFPLGCGLAVVLLAWHLSRRMFSGLAAAMVFGFFAVDYPAIRYSAEAKPYGTDLLAALVLVVLAVEWLRRPRRRGWLWLLAMATPLAVGLSYPAVFVAGGASAAVAWVLWRRRLHGGWIPWTALNLLMTATFAAQLRLAQISVKPETARAMQSYWKACFPPLGSPAGLAGWLLDAHTGEMMQHPAGGKRGASTLTAVLGVAGLVMLWRRRQGALLSLVLVPPALGLAAAAMHRYPYGGPARLAMHLTPIVCVLAGLGASGLLARLGAGRPGGRRAVAAALALLAVLPAGSAVRDLIHPQRSENDRRARDFARWFWLAKSLDGELVCLKTDLQESFQSAGVLDGDEAIYLCNQRIYSPRHARGQPPAWQRISKDWPLRCVRFTAGNYASDEAAFRHWLAGMQTRWRLVGQERHLLPVFLGGGPPYVNTLEVYQFVPQSADAPGRGPALLPASAPASGSGAADQGPEVAARPAGGPCRLR